MTNMSYCRFENTLRDLRDCTGALEEMMEAEDLDHDVSLSAYELEAAKSLATECLNLLEKLGEACGHADYALVEGPAPEILIDQINTRARRAYERQVSGD